jgi:hypothetical protein
MKERTELGAFKLVGDKVSNRGEWKGIVRGVRIYVFLSGSITALLLQCHVALAEPGKTYKCSGSRKRKNYV